MTGKPPSPPSGSVQQAAAATTPEQAIRAVERELEYLGLSLAVFAPHGFDSSRSGDSAFADDHRASLNRLKEAWEVVRASIE